MSIWAVRERAKCRWRVPLDPLGGYRCSRGGQIWANCTDYVTASAESLPTWQCRWVSAGNVIPYHVRLLGHSSAAQARAQKAGQPKLYCTEDMCTSRMAGLVLVMSHRLDKTRGTLEKHEAPKMESQPGGFGRRH